MSLPPGEKKDGRRQSGATEAEEEEMVFLCEFPRQQQLYEGAWML